MPDLVFAAASLYLASFFLRALGWQRLFPGERPDRSRCLAACGAAAASGVVLPFRLDYVVKISTLRRLGGVRLGLDTVGLSILSLGLVDAVAMLPLAIGRHLDLRRDLPRAADRRDALLPRLHRRARSRSAARPAAVRVSLSRGWSGSLGRVGEHAGISRATFVAVAFLFGCWTTRALGSTLLLSALGVGFSPTFALVILCMARRRLDPADHRRRRDRRRRRVVGRAARARRLADRCRQLLARLRACSSPAARSSQRWSASA